MGPAVNRVTAVAVKWVRVDEDSNEVLRNFFSFAPAINIYPFLDTHMQIFNQYVDNEGDSTKSISTNMLIYSII